MSVPQQHQHQQPRNQNPRPPKHQSRTPAKKEKRPQLTHFLCLPLVNSTSLPQLESSLAAFKAEIPSPTHDQSAEPHPLIPDAAIRPVGTLHLTLGVMSLPSPERLDEAIRFLQSLDLVALVREAARIARVRTPGKAPPQEALGSDGPSELGKQGEERSPSPFTVSLESLHALPRARSATVLHAAPVDSTSRLYPFCEMLRDKFLDAGFLQGEVQKDDTSKKPQQEGGDKSANQPSGSDSRPPETEGERSQKEVEEPSLLEDMPVDVAIDVAKKSDQPITPTPPASRKPKPRPLLLHATVVNTIYIKGRSRGTGGGKSQKNSRYSFDARDLVARYRDYYLDTERTIPRPSAIPADSRQEDGGNDKGDGGNKSAQNPFVWARDFTIESVCICEMGAKKLDPEGDKSGLNARLREKYMAVAERSLDF